MTSIANADDRHTLQCMDLWSGNRSVENEVSTPGFDIFVYSQPCHGESQGGDVHYVSLCAGGIVTRFILADVSGHGVAVSETSQTLRALMRRFMNSKSQGRLVRDLNREFSRLAEAGRFATAIVGTHVSRRGCLSICNAGHPRPFRFQQASHRWSVIEGELVGASDPTNLPLGLDDSTTYRQFEIPIADGDIVVLYTDALIEARDRLGNLLGEQNLLQLVSRVTTTDSVREFGRGILNSLRDVCGSDPDEDDLTILVLKFVAGRRRTSSVVEKLNAYAKMLGLRSV